MREVSRLWQLMGRMDECTQDAALVLLWVMAGTPGPVPVPALYLKAARSRLTEAAGAAAAKGRPDIEEAFTRAAAAI